MGTLCNYNFLDYYYLEQYFFIAVDYTSVVLSTSYTKYRGGTTIKKGEYVCISAPYLKCMDIKYLADSIFLVRPPAGVVSM